MRLHPALTASVAIVAVVSLAIVYGVAPGELVVGTALGAWLLVLTVGGLAAMLLGSAVALVVPALLVGLAAAGAVLWVRNGRRRAPVRTA